MGRLGTRLVGVAVVLTGLVALSSGGCKGSEGSDKSSKIDAGEAVEQYFAAIESHDCDSLVSLSVSEIDCAELIESFEHRGVKLLRIVSAKPDGRFPEVRIVEIKARKAGKEIDWLIRAEPSGDSWKLEL